MSSEQRAGEKEPDTRESSKEGVELTEHPADVGIRSWARTRERALELACIGLMRIMTDPDRVEEREEHIFEVDAGSERDVLRRTLSEVVFLTSSENLFFSSFSVEWSADRVRVVCRGEPINPERHELLTEVKAITPSQLSFGRVGSSWCASVLVDV